MQLLKYINTNKNSEWYENLPESCPPLTAERPKGYCFFRMYNEPIGSESFISQVAEGKSDKINDCILNGVSIFAKENDLHKYLKLPAHKGKKIVQIKLNEHDGVIMKTFSRSHHTWWRSKTFDFNTSIVKL